MTRERETNAPEALAPETPSLEPPAREDRRPAAAHLAAIDAFAGLSPDELAVLADRTRLIAVARGALLIRQGAPADALFLVVSGRFDVLVDGRSGTVATIGAGRPIGEIGFFAGGVRTATVRAGRDSLVLRLDRAAFEALADGHPGLWRAITAALARRLAATTVGDIAKPRPVPRSVCLAPAGVGEGCPELAHRLAERLAATGRCLLLDEAGAAARLGSGADLDTAEATRALNALEADHDRLVLVAGPTLSDWTRKAIRQADVVLLHGRADDGGRVDARELAATGVVERFAASLHEAGALRLVIAHRQRGVAAGTRAIRAIRPWLGMHHHASLADDADLDRVVRFVDGAALGLVACGGGAFCVSHLGVFEALAESGLAFDMLGGTSGGAAMAAAWLIEPDIDEIERRLHDMFVTRRAMWQWTWPRYSLIDHTAFDEALIAHYGERDIADLWLPFFALTTNLTRNSAQAITEGPLWAAVRASSAIPALLPPVFTVDGDMLVDGCILDNVPLIPMQGLKGGPNVVVDFDVPREDRFVVDHRALPSRWRLIGRSLTPAARRALPVAPSPGSVLMRSLMLNRGTLDGAIAPRDLLLRPPIPPGIGHLDWHRHAELRQRALAWARREIAGVRSSGHDLWPMPS